MAIADVVGGEGKPHLLVRRHRVRHLLHHLLQVAGTPLDAFFRVGSIVDPHRLGGGFGQHHHAAHPCVGAGLGVPVGLLIADGGQQAPVYVLGVGLEQRLVLGQQALGPLEEGAGVDEIEVLHVAEVLLVELGDGAIHEALAEEVDDAGVEAVIGQLGHGPGHCLLAGQSQPLGELGVVALGAGQHSVLHHRVVHLAVGDLLEQLLHVGVPVDAPAQIGVLAGQLLHQILTGGARRHHYGALDVAEILGPGGAVAIDQLGGDLVEAGAEAKQLAPLRGHHDGGGGEIQAPLLQLFDQLGGGVGRDYGQLDPQPVGIVLRQLVIEPLGGVVTLVIGSGTIEGANTDLAPLADLLQLAGGGIEVTAGQGQCQQHPDKQSKNAAQVGEYPC